MEIWLVRHGETFGNKKMLIQGHSGGTLTPLGEQQALLNQKKLANVNFDEIHVSDSFRTRQTAHIILGSRYAQAVINSNSAFLTFILGKSTSLRCSERKAAGCWKANRFIDSGTMRNKSSLPFREYKAEGGESWNDVHNRAKEFFSNLCKTHFYGEETKDFVVDIRKAVEIGDDYSSLKDEEQKMPE